MKSPKNTTLYSRLALITSVTLVVGYFVVYAAYQTFTSPEYQSGAALSSTFLGKIVSNLDEINGRVTTLEGSIAGASIWSKVGSDISYTAGKVGVGATTGNAELDIQSGIKPHWGIYHDETTEQLRFWNGDNRVVIGSTGNVGIGTVSPGAKLHIYQSTRNTDGLIVQGSTINTDGQQGYIAITLDGDYGNKTGNYSQIRSYSNLYGNWGSDLAFFVTKYEVGNTLEEKMRITRSGNVGIGTASPGAKLDILGDNNQLFINTAGSYSSIYFYKSGVNNGALYTDGAITHLENRGSGRLTFGGGITSAENMVILNNGNVGIGTTAPSQKLEVMGTVLADAHTTHSDIRYKKDITTLTDSLDKFMKIRGVRFLWRDSDKNQDPQVGVIAQEVEKEFPEVVTTSQDGYKSVAYDKLIAPLIEAVKELRKENDFLKQENQDIKSLVCSDHPTALICK